jgi:hypothetical protein
LVDVVPLLLQYPGQHGEETYRADAEQRQTELDPWLCCGKPLLRDNEALGNLVDRPPPTSHRSPQLAATFSTNLIRAEQKGKPPRLLGAAVVVADVA